MRPSWAPGPFPDRLAPVICTGFPSSPLVSTVSGRAWFDLCPGTGSLGQRGGGNMLFADTPSSLDSDVPACRLFKYVVLPPTVRSISHRHFTVH